MRFLIAVTCFCFVVQYVRGLPVTPPKVKPDDKHEVNSDNNEAPENLENILEYERYLKEVVNALESDPEFRQKLDKATEIDIRTGKIAQELEYVNHQVRTKLDEIKRQELDRLRSLATRQYELSNDIDRDHLKIPEHVDHDNQHTFEIEDLKKLILKTSEDLAEADKKRRDEFKQYELQKEFEKHEKINELDDEHKKQYEQELKEQQEKHNKHEKVHHPGNKAQLEEVWEKQDHMEGMEFDPKTFFMMHDVDSNNFWDETEVKALFIKELDKVYQSGLPEDDMRERAEEMERMREHVFKEADTNHDGLISYQEFLDQTKRDEFQRDPGWDTVDNAPQFTHEEYVEFERRRHEEIQKLIAEGKLPPHPNMPQGYYPGQQGQYQAHPNDINQGYQGHPNQQYHPNQPPQYNPNQGHPNPQYHPNQVPQQQYQAHPNQQQYQGHPNQQQYQQPPPQQQYQQPPQQQQYHQQQQPQQVKLNPNQVYEHVDNHHQMLQNQQINQQAPQQPNQKPPQQHQQPPPQQQQQQPPQQQQQPPPQQQNQPPPPQQQQQQQAAPAGPVSPQQNTAQQPQQAAPIPAVAQQPPQAQNNPPQQQASQGQVQAPQQQSQNNAPNQANANTHH